MLIPQRYRDSKGLFRNFKGEKRKRLFFITAIVLIGLLGISILITHRRNNLGKEEIAGQREVKPLSERDEFDEGVISASDGGELNAGQIKVVFPPGFTDEDIIASFRLLNTDKLRAYHQIGVMYELSAQTVSGKAITQFNKPVTIITNVGEEDVKDYKVEKIASYFYSQENSRWEKLESTFDTGKDEIIASTDHFTVFTSAGKDPNNQSNGIFGIQTIFTTQAQESSSGSGNSNTYVIIDNSDPAPYFETGSYSDEGQPSWWGVLYSGYNGTALFTGNSIDSTPRNWATWTAQGISGTIEVFATIPSGPFIFDVPSSPYFGKNLPLTHGANYVVGHAGGQTVVTIDQAAHEGGVVSLGTYDFAGSGSVYLSDVISESGAILLSSVVFDAVSFGGGFDEDLDLTPPSIEDVKSHTDNGTFIIQATITDTGSGVDTAYVYFNGQLYQMYTSGNDIYSVAIPYSQGENLDYYILAYDVAGNEAVWNKERGYVSRGSFTQGLGLPRWAFYYGRNNYRYNAKGRCMVTGCENDTNNQFRGDPVNTQSGNLVEQQKIVTISGRPEIDLHLTYNSQGGRLGIFGQSWTHNYNYHVLEMDSQDFQGAFVQYPDGQVVKFSGTNFVPEDGCYEKLVKTGPGYELTFKDLTKVSFDSDGDIIRWEDANGNGINFTYSNKASYTLLSQITSIKADSGREIRLEYDNNGLVEKVIAPENKVIRFEYSNDEDLTKIIDANGGEIGFEYNDHNMTKRISPKGHPYFVNTYNGERQVIKQVGGTSFENKFTYESNKTIVTDAYGNTVEYRFRDDLLQSIIDPFGKSMQYRYDVNKNVISISDREGNTYELKYDNNGNQIYIKDPLHFEIEREFNTTFNKPVYEKHKQEDHITQWEYDAKGNLTKTINAKGDESSFTYNGHGQPIEFYDFNGNKTSFTYNSFGDLETITDALNYTEKLTRDDAGRLVKWEDGNNNIYEVSYDTNDNLTEIRGPLGYKLEFKYDKNNNLFIHKDANGGEIKYIYDASENLIEVKNQLDFPTKYTYGAMNELLTKEDAQGSFTTIGYDIAFNIKSITEATGTEDERTTTFEYNAMRYPVEVIDPEARTAKYEYDPLYRITKEIQNVTDQQPDQQNNVTTKYEYSATDNITKIIDPNRNETTYTYDSLDQLLSTKDAENNITKYEYNAQGNLTKLINPRDFETIYKYDTLNRLEEVIDAKAGEVAFVYDGNDNITSITDANKKTTKFIFDPFDRLIEQIQNFAPQMPSNPDTNVKTKFSYDLHGNLTSVTNPRNYTTYLSYDPAHRNIEMTDALLQSIILGYDKVDNIISVTDQNQHTIHQKFDALNRLVQKTNPEEHSFRYIYDKVDNIKTFTDARGYSTTYSYDPLDRPVKKTDALDGIWEYRYDPVGNLTQEIDANSHPISYEYDKYIVY